MIRVKYFKPASLRAEDRLSRAVCSQIRRDFGALVEPMALHLPSPAILAGAWASLREVMLVGTVPRRLKETVAASISRINSCSFCVDAHTIMLSATGSPREARAIRKGPGRIADPDIAEYAQWAGATREPGAAILKKPPFSMEDAPEMVATAFCFHYVNRLVTVLLGDSPVPTRLPGVRQAIIWFSDRFFASFMSQRRQSGDSLQFLPAGPLSENFFWARSRGNVHTALTGLEDSIESTVSETLDSGVRKRLQDVIGRWRGGDPPLGGAWIGEAVEGLSKVDRAAASLALLAALAPHRIDRNRIEGFLQLRPRDGDLLAVLCWGSMTAAKTIALWLAEASNLRAERGLSGKKELAGTGPASSISLRL